MTHPHAVMSIRHMDMSICHTTRQSICQATHQSVALSVCTTASPSVIPVCPSHDLTIHHPINSSLTHLSVSPDHLYDEPTSPSACLSLPDRLYDKPTSPSTCPSLPDCLYNEPTSPSACPSQSDRLTATMTRPAIHPSTHPIHCTPDSSQSLSVVNGEQSRKIKKFCRVFTNYDLLLHALDVSSIYLSDSRHVAPPKSGEDAHVTRGRCDLGRTTLNKPRLGFCYRQPRLWDPGATLINT